MYHCKNEEDYCIELNSIGFGILLSLKAGAHEFTEFQHTGA